MLAASVLLLSACASPPPPAMASGTPLPPAAPPVPAGPQTFRGVARFGFEVSRFEGCWINLAGDVRAEFDRRHPEVAETRRNGGVYEYEIAFEGTRSSGGQYGHMGMARCQFEAVRLIDSRRVPPPSH